MSNRILSLTNQGGPEDITGTQHARKRALDVNSIPLNLLVDQVSTSELYIGESMPGSSLFRIQKVLISGSQISVLWANGDSQFLHAWADRASLTYV